MTNAAPRQNRVRAYIPAPCGKAQVQAGLAWLARTCVAKRTRGLILVASLRQVEIGLFPEVLGAAMAKMARKDKRIAFAFEGQRVEVDVLTERQLGSTHGVGAVLALWPGDTMFEAIDKFGYEPDLVAVAWSQDSNQDWERRLGLVPLGSSAPVQEDACPVFGAALETLTVLVNMSTGIGHPSDRDSFVEMLYQLRDGGEPMTPDYCSRKLIQLGWTAGHANDAAELVRKILGGARIKRPRMPMWSAGSLERWRRRSRGEEE